MWIDASTKLAWTTRFARHKHCSGYEIIWNARTHCTRICLGERGGRKHTAHHVACCFVWVIPVSCIYLLSPSLYVCIYIPVYKINICTYIWPFLFDSLYLYFCTKTVTRHLPSTGRQWRGCHVMACHVVPWHAMPCRGMPWHASCHGAGQSLR